MNPLKGFSFFYLFPDTLVIVAEADVIEALNIVFKRDEWKRAIFKGLVHTHALRSCWCSFLLVVFLLLVYRQSCTLFLFVLFSLSLSLSLSLFNVSVFDSIICSYICSLNSIWIAMLSKRWLLLKVNKRFK